VVTQCTEILASWGENISEPKGKPDGVTATEVIIAPIALYVWFIVGTGLLGVFIAISAVTIPLLIGGGIIYLIWQLLKKNR
jgi:hypothetical protein